MSDTTLQLRYSCPCALSSAPSSLPPQFSFTFSKTFSFPNLHNIALTGKWLWMLHQLLVSTSWLPNVFVSLGFFCIPAARNITVGGVGDSFWGLGSELIFSLTFGFLINFAVFTYYFFVAFFLLF